MKRSEINANIRLATEMFDKHCFKLPKWAYWTPEEWKKAGPEAAEIRKNSLGWDITDFGLNDFKSRGLILFTIRNGNYHDKNNVKTYAEKIMVALDRQITPLHFHWAKMEDIINRGGGNLVIKLYNSTPDEELDKTNDVKASIDGVVHTVKPGGTVTLTPGESICLAQGMYHTFWAEGGNCMIGEVSMVNDDANDNRFYEEIGRFPKIEEDEPAFRLLGNEYPELG